MARPRPTPEPRQGHHATRTRRGAYESADASVHDPLAARLDWHVRWSLIALVAAILLLAAGAITWGDGPWDVALTAAGIAATLLLFIMAWTYSQGARWYAVALGLVSYLVVGLVAWIAAGDAEGLVLWPAYLSHGTVL